MDLPARTPGAGGEAIAIKALSLWQPWASLIAKGAKRVETRPWSTRHRGPLAIHAALTQQHLTYPNPALDLLVGLLDEGERIPVGAVVATCRLVDVVRTADLAAVGWAEHGGWRREPIGRYSVSDSEVPLGNYDLGRFAWLLDDVRELRPIGERGHQGLWEWSAEAYDALEGRQ